jgi:hypothetical protein
VQGIRGCDEVIDADDGWGFDRADDRAGGACLAAGGLSRGILQLD